MKTKIPDELKTDLPQTKWGKVLSATPVVMTVIATMLAGLSSSEMTRAQYDRSLAAQQQSKAGDQWGYFQAKKLRSALQHNTLDLLGVTATIQPLDSARLPASADATVVAALQKGSLPAIPPAAPLDAPVQAALEGIEKQLSEPEISQLLASVDPLSLEAALTSARERTTAFDGATKPVSLAIDQLEKSVIADKPASASFTVARLRYSSARYEAEARLNQTIANLLELQVRINNISAERHHRRSSKFFYGMLAAQMAVILATFAMAAQKRNILWTIAATAGLAAVIFAVYVYVKG